MERCLVGYIRLVVVVFSYCPSACMSATGPYDPGHRQISNRG